jgi:hypothetical protein
MVIGDRGMKSVMLDIVLVNLVISASRTLLSQIILEKT